MITGKCPYCERGDVELTKHHLVPQSRISRYAKKLGETPQELRERVVWLCRPCHSNGHDHLTEKEMALVYNTQEKLAAHPAMVKFTDWLKKSGAKGKIKHKSARSKKK